MDVTCVVTWRLYMELLTLSSLGRTVDETQILRFNFYTRFLLQKKRCIPYKTKQLGPFASRTPTKPLVQEGPAQNYDRLPLSK